MTTVHLLIAGLAVAAAAAVLSWLVSIARHDVSIVDSLWSILLLLLGLTYAHLSGIGGGRTVVVLALLAAWSLRLSIYITWRNHGHGEDRRYQEIRRRNQPNFAFKSLYLVFLLQTVLASLVSLPLLGALMSARSLGYLDIAGVLLWLLGMVFEVGGDAQLSRFKADPDNRGRVMDRGFWRLTRHPNYFGEFCIWWGFFLIALSGGAWWSAVGSLVMSVLLLKVSGVALLEQTIQQRRPDYEDYVRRTSAFFPWRPAE